jgi:hypothetical protein
VVVYIGQIPKLVTPFVYPLTYTGLKAIHNLFLGKSTLAKAEGMLRFYLQGKRLLAQQDWPEVLLKHKDAILSEVPSAP